MIINIILSLVVIVLATLVTMYRRMWLNARGVNTELIIRLAETKNSDLVREVLLTNPNQNSKENGK